MKFFGEQNYDEVKKQIDEALAIDDEIASEYIFRRKVISQYMLSQDIDKKYVDKVYQIYLDEDIISKIVENLGIKAAMCFRLNGQNDKYRELLEECTPYLFGVKYEGYIPSGVYSPYMGDALRIQLHGLLVQKKFFDFYAQTSTDQQAYILGYIPKTPWRKSNYIDLIYTAKCVEKVHHKESPIKDYQLNWWIDT